MSKSYDPEAMHREHFYTFSEVCARQSLDKDFIVHCVNYGIIEVSGGQEEESWQFAFSVIPKLEKAYRLHRDLEIDYNGLAMVLELLDEIEDLRVLNDLLNRKLADWEADW